jgi:hypothetical protein
MNYINKYAKQGLFYKNAGNAYYRMCYTFKPITKENGKIKESTTLNTIGFDFDRRIAQVLISSNTFNYYWFTSSDCYHLTKKDIYNFPVFDLSLMPKGDHDRLIAISNAIEENYKQHSIMKTTKYKTKGIIEYQEFYPRYAKDIFNEVDCILASYYGFADEELDFIINYDIKYRIGICE